MMMTLWDIGNACMVNVCTLYQAVHAVMANIMGWTSVRVFMITGVVDFLIKYVGNGIRGLVYNCTFTVIPHNCTSMR